MTDFVPYSDVYGQHPSDFTFDAEGNMVPRPHSDVSVGSEVQCVKLMGAPYCTRPHLNSQFEDCRDVPFGERVVVLQVCEHWARDAIGWLPLQLDGEMLFEPISVDDPKERLHLPSATNGQDDLGGSDSFTCWGLEDDLSFPGMNSACIPTH